MRPPPCRALPKFLHPRFAVGQVSGPGGNDGRGPVRTDRLLRRLEDRKIFVTLTDPAKEWLVREGYDPAYGARPLKRALQRHILDSLAMRVLDGEFREGDHVQVDASPDCLQFVKQQAGAVVG